jgi:hypothetical protein
MSGSGKRAGTICLTLSAASFFLALLPHVRMRPDPDYLPWPFLLAFLQVISFLLGIVGRRTPQGDLGLIFAPVCLAAILWVARDEMAFQASGRRPPTMTSLKQIAVAMMDYDSVYGSLPCAAIYDNNGGPLLSWRVRILPYLGEQSLFDQFNLTEQWDSPHNLDLLRRMPKVYAHDARSTAGIEAFHTLFKVFVGKGAAFEGTRGMKVPDDFPDGSSNTILLIETGAAVPWTKPEDVAYDPDGPLPPLATVRKHGFYVAFADGSVRFVGAKIGETSIRAAITRNGYDKPLDDWDD